MSTVDLRELAIDRGGAAQPRLRRARHLLTRYLFPAVLLAGFAALAMWASWDFISPPKPVSVAPVHATLAAAHSEGTPLFKAAGWIEPRPTPIRVAALAPGVVERLLVVEDQEVKAGDAVAELVKDDARLSLEATAAELAIREAEVEEMKAAHVAAMTRFEQPVHLQAPLSEAESALAQVATQLKNLPHETKRAEAALALAKQDFDVKNELKDIVSGLSLARARSELQSAEALLNELRERAASLEAERTALVARRDALKTQLELCADEIKACDEAQARINAATARAQQAHVAVEEAKLRLKRMTIPAPVDGRVYRLIAPPGAALSGAMVTSEDYDGTTVVTMYQPNMLQVRVDVRFDDIPNVTLGQPARIENPAIKEPLTGKVLFISSQANIQKNTLDVKVAIDAPPSVFKPEMLVDVTFLAPAEADKHDETMEMTHIYLPQQLVHQDEAGSFVWLADQSAGRARRMAVEVGNAGNDGLIEVTAGLDETSHVIVDGAETLHDGDRIRITGEATDAAAPPAAGGKRKALHRLHTGETDDGPR